MVLSHQVQEPVTYVSAQLLMHECVKLLDSNQSFLKEVNMDEYVHVPQYFSVLIY